mgnify:CR=1 FL=1
MTTFFLCRACGASQMFPGNCAACLRARRYVAVTPQGDNGSRSSGVVSLADIPATITRRPVPGWPGLDLILDGGLVPGSVLCLYGGPGSGKTTWAMQLAEAMSDPGGIADQEYPLRRALMVSGELAAPMVRLYADRLGIVVELIDLLCTETVDQIEAAVTIEPPPLLVVDSLQVLSAEATDGAPGDPAQVRAVARRLVALARATDVPTLLLLQSTKDEGYAGPRLVEHLVDGMIALGVEGADEAAETHAQPCPIGSGCLTCQSLGPIVTATVAGKYRFGPTGRSCRMRLTARGMVAA